MKFRVRGFKGNTLCKESVFLGQNSKVYYCGGLVGFEEVKGAKIELLIGKDSLGNDVYENDTLLSEKSIYTAGFNMDMGAYLESELGGKIPFKQCVEKLVLREKK